MEIDGNDWMTAKHSTGVSNILIYFHRLCGSIHVPNEIDSIGITNECCSVLIADASILYFRPQLWL